MCVFERSKKGMEFNMNNKLLKELLIALLLVAVIIFTISILFYDCFPFSEDRVKSIEYKADEKVKATITEIEKKSTISEDEKNKSLKTYTVDKADLTAYLGEEVEAGKKDPFAEVSEPIEEVVTTESTGGETSKSNSSNPSENIGTFFESENSK